MRASSHIGQASVQLIDPSDAEIQGNSDIADYFFELLLVKLFPEGPLPSFVPMDDVSVSSCHTLKLCSTTVEFNDSTKTIIKCWRS